MLILIVLSSDSRLKRRGRRGAALYPRRTAAYSVTPCLKIAMSWKPADSLHTFFPDAGLCIKLIGAVKNNAGFCGIRNYKAKGVKLRQSHVLGVIVIGIHCVCNAGHLSVQNLSFAMCSPICPLAYQLQLILPFPNKVSVL